MSAFLVTFQTDTAAFELGGATEIARILRQIAKKVEAGTFSGSIMDINGNRVGNFLQEQP